MERELSKQQEAVLLRAQLKGGTCLSTTAFSALFDLGVTLTGSKPGFNSRQCRRHLAVTGRARLNREKRTRRIPPDRRGFSSRPSRAKPWCELSVRITREAALRTSFPQQAHVNPGESVRVAATFLCFARFCWTLSESSDHTSGWLKTVIPTRPTGAPLGSTICPWILFTGSLYHINF